MTLKIKDFYLYNRFCCGISVLHYHFVVIEFDRKLDFATSDGNLEFAVCIPVTQRPFAKVQIIL